MGTLIRTLRPIDSAACSFPTPGTLALVSDAAAAALVAAGLAEPLEREVSESTYTAQSVLAAATAGSPAPVTLAEGTILGRAAGGDVGALTATEVQLVILSSVAAQETAAVGSELITSTGWTLGSGWAGTFADGFTHTTGTAALSWAPSFATGTKIYMVEFTVESPTDSSAFTVTLGGSFGMVMYEGATGGSHVYSRGIQSISDGSLVFTPESAFDGRIHSVSIKEVASATDALTTWRDSAEDATLEVRPGPASLRNIFLGYEVGRYNVTGHENVAVGDGAMRVSTSGFWNVAVGRQALEANTNGTRNVALGYTALQRNVTGHRNIGIGPFALRDNTDGKGNIALGADVAWMNTTGDYNIAMGQAALGESLTGNCNVAIGRAALAKQNGVSDSIAIGDYALYEFVTGSQPMLAIGQDALRNAIGSPNMAIGDQAGKSITTAVGNLLIGQRAMQSGTGANNVVIGHDAMYQATGERNVILGYNSAYGGSAGVSINRNVIIGYNMAPSIGTGADRNTLVGVSAASSLTTGTDNICLGYNTQLPSATQANYMNLGNLIYGTLASATKQVGINITAPTARMHLPTTDGSANTAPLKINAGTLLGTPEAGAIEFDGTNLYFTTSGGVRKTITAA